MRRYVACTSNGTGLNGRNMQKSAALTEICRPCVTSQWRPRAEVFLEKCPREVILNLPSSGLSYLWMYDSPRGVHQRCCHLNASPLEVWERCLCAYCRLTKIYQHRPVCADLEVEIRRRFSAGSFWRHEEFAAAVQTDHVLKLCPFGLDEAVCHLKDDCNVVFIPDDPCLDAWVWEVTVLSLRPWLAP